MAHRNRTRLSVEQLEVRDTPSAARLVPAIIFPAVHKAEAMINASLAVALNGAGSDRPMESLSLNFAKITMTIAEKVASGAIQPGSYDLSFPSQLWMKAYEDMQIALKVQMQDISFVAINPQTGDQATIGPIIDT